MTTPPAQKDPFGMRRRALSRLAAFARLSEDDIERLADIAGTPVVLEKGMEIRREDDSPACLHLLLSGWAASAHTLASGSRQLTSVSLPGDILGLPTLAIAVPLDTVIALTEVIVCHIPILEFTSLFEKSPRLAFLLFLVSQEERSLAMERLALMGGARAKTRVAALFVRLSERNAQLGEDRTTGFFMPLTQKEIADLAGMSPVHTNKVIQSLRHEGVLRLNGKRLDILDYAKLCDIAQIMPWERAEPTWLP